MLTINPKKKSYVQVAKKKKTQSIFVIKSLTLIFIKKKTRQSITFIIERKIMLE
jgi:hypothetical protein